MKPSQARKIWMHAQRLTSRAPFGEGDPESTCKAIEHLGYVQIDTINVIERCHHHILFTRIPGYKKQHLHHAQTVSKTVFEYWTHALSYVPTRDYRFFIQTMKDIGNQTGVGLERVDKSELQRVLRRIKKDGAISIRDIHDDELVEKAHPWASRKPSKKALQLGFYMGRLVISERQGMLKKYELTDRHFGWESQPKAATEKETSEYLLRRALRSQGLVSLDSICHLNTKKKAGIRRLIEQKVSARKLVPTHLDGFEKITHWIEPETLEKKLDPPSEELVHILSPFDPLTIQRKRLKVFFDYNHIFEAYLPQSKRVYGYFALPVLLGDRIVAAIDLKTDRAKNKLLIQKWNWIGSEKSVANKKKIEEELGRFESFQLQRAL